MPHEEHAGTEGPIATMHVCMLTARRFPPNERLRKEAAALRAGGHAVTVCARGASGQPERDVVAGVDVRRVPDGTLYAGVRGKLDGAHYALGFVHPAWLRAVSAVDDERSLDACSVHDASLLKTGLRVGETHDIPVVCDVSNDVSAVVGGDGRERGRLRGFARRVFHPSWRRERVASAVLPAADRVLVTCEEARARQVRETGVDPRRVAVVRDTTEGTLPELDDSTESDRPDRPGGLGFDPDEAFVVTAFGDPADEGFETLVEAAARAAGDVVSLRLVLVGDAGEDRLDALETQAKRRLAGGRVAFRTNVEPAQTVEYVAASDVCVFPRSSAALTVPSQLFAAFSMGVPVVVTDRPPLDRLVARTGAGEVVPVGDAAALTTALVSLSTPERAAEAGANGRLAVERYNWERDARHLRAAYESLAGDTERLRTVPTADL